VLVVEGRDRLRFLHAVTTQDVARLEPGEGAYGALTDDRGRPISDFVLSVLPDAVRLEAPAACADALKAALERLIVADDVELAWAEDASASDAPAAAEDARLDALDIRAFRPGPSEFAEARVWNELDRMDAISFTKGCFLGQEILNRVQSQGQLQRRLVTLALEGPAAEPALLRGATLTGPDGEPAGIVTRAAQDVAFAFVKRGAWEPGTRLVAHPPSGPAIAATVRPKSTVEVP
jgi:folate-binding protein YgfZ